MIKQSVTTENCMELILNNFPDFKKKWEKYSEYWGDDERTIGIDVTEFSRYAVEIIRSNDQHTMKKMFDFVEQCLSSNDEDVTTAFTTMFLENIQNVLTPQELEVYSFATHLGTKSREYCKSWDEFTGEKTPGL